MLRFLFIYWISANLPSLLFSACLLGTVFLTKSLCFLMNYYIFVNYFDWYLFIINYTVLFINSYILHITFKSINIVKVL